MWKIIKELTFRLLKPLAFSYLILGIFLIQLVIANNWINTSIGSYSGFGILVSLLVFVTGIDWLGNTGIYYFRKINIITPWDVLLYGIVWEVLINLACFKLHDSLISPIIFFLFIGVGAMSSILLGLRIYKICKLNDNDKDKDEAQLVDLRDLNKAKITWSKDNGAIIIDERAVDYDLFNRDTVQKQLKDAIRHFSAKHSYVVGFVGKWGSGKTTLLKKLKKDFSKSKDTVFIHAPNTTEDFDLWLFGSKEEMIKGIYDTFLNSMGIKFNSLKNSKMLEGISKVVAGIPSTGPIISPLISGGDSYNDVTLLKERLSEYIKSTHKHYIMCIENLDRASNDQIILFLKLISTIFDFPSVTYILLYDDERLNKVLESAKDVNKTYKEKVINQEVKIPLMINPSVSIRCMQNLLLSYGFSEKELENFYVVLNTVAQNLSNVRELKVIMNSEFSIFAIKDKIRLNYPQILAIQYIFHMKPDLYEKIRENRDLLVVTKESEFNNINDEATESRLKDLVAEYPAYKGLLKDLFPKVKIATAPNQIVRDYHLMVSETKRKLICLPQYFNNYFMLIEDDYTELINLLSDFIKEVNKNNVENLYTVWSKFILNHDQTEKNRLIEQMNIFITKEDILSSEKREKLSEIIVKSFIDKREWSKYYEFAIARCIAILIGEIFIKDLDTFKNFIANKYHHELSLIEQISSYMNGEGRLGGTSNEFLKNGEIIKSFYNGIQRKCYKELDINRLINSNSPETIELIGRCISPYTVYDIMKDAINNKGIVDGVFVDVFKKYSTEMKAAFNGKKPENSAEEALYKIYKKFD